MLSNKIFLPIIAIPLAIYYFFPSINFSPVWFIVAFTLYFTLKGFNDRTFLMRGAFSKDRFLKRGEYYRSLSYGFFHDNGLHLFFNAFSFISFAPYLEREFNSNIYRSSFYFLLFYITSLFFSLVMDLLSREREVLSVGASGGICAIIGMFIYLNPSVSLFLFFIPIPIPGPLFLILFLVISYKLSLGNSHIGHKAHISGTIFGLITGVIFSLIF